MTKVLAVASGGGHWEQLAAIRESFVDSEVYFVTTINGLAEDAGIGSAFIVSDCNRDRPIQVLRCVVQLWKIQHKVRPDCIITTGAAPGLIAIAIGKVLGVSTIFLDSIANSEQLSLSGRIALRIADLTLTQWRHLSSDRGPKYMGSVL